MASVEEQGDMEQLQMHGNALGIQSKRYECKEREGKLKNLRKIYPELLEPPSSSLGFLSAISRSP